MFGGRGTEWRRRIGMACVLSGLLWFVVGCAAPVPDMDGAEPEHDLMVEARGWVEKDGRAKACKRLNKEVAKLDDSGGMFEKRLMRANDDKARVFPDSVATLPRAERKRVGIYFLLGFNQDRGRSPPIVERAARRLRERGFRARVIPVEGRRTAQQDAAMVRKYLARELPEVDRAILVGFSKGSGDLTEFWLGQARKLPPEELKKIHLWANFAGVLRGSEVARWLACESGPKEVAYRAFVNLKSGRPLARFDDLASIATDPWATGRRRMPENLASGFLVIDVVVIPDGPEGWSESDPLFERLGRAASAERRLGPCDGLVESASSVLPKQIGVRQWIVRVHGSHALLDGRYPNGSPVAPGYLRGGESQLESGMELMDDFLRALPKSAIGL